MDSEILPTEILSVGEVLERVQDFTRIPEIRALPSTFQQVQERVFGQQELEYAKTVNGWALKSISPDDFLFCGSDYTKSRLVGIESVDTTNVSYGHDPRISFLPLSPEALEASKTVEPQALPFAWANIYTLERMISNGLKRRDSLRCGMDIVGRPSVTYLGEVWNIMRRRGYGNERSDDYESFHDLTLYPIDPSKFEADMGSKIFHRVDNTGYWERKHLKDPNDFHKISADLLQFISEYKSQLGVK